MWGALSDERTGLSFIIAAHPHQRSHFWSESRGTCDYVTVPDSRLPFSSPCTTRRARLEIFDPVSTWGPLKILSAESLASERTHRERHLQHLFYRCVTSPLTCLPNRSMATAVCVTYNGTTYIIACGHYTATTVSLAP
jgi:hypothetical protein